MRNSNTTIYLVQNHNIFSSSQLHVSTIYGHHQAGHKEQSNYRVMFRTEICICTYFLSCGQPVERTWLKHVADLN